ncbi:hypothetical protein [Anaerotalea alkaliphila]|uniref:Uncharacterized protein n=1 Tax=Anaerotalea alkaliphila TaxID=2662126 RepID=A0A7X5HUN6_9FIRM|nr:hypothetical protein [Anaerotalea alkaliphila]NDL66983.1 hypothetical protein [Anaerotalea alkaliphila]
MNNYLAKYAILGYNNFEKNITRVAKGECAMGYLVFIFALGMLAAEAYIGKNNEKEQELGEEQFS